jgi:hypothetical protein
MSIDATKKRSTPVITEPQQLELENQIRLRAYELYDKEAEKTVMSWKTGSAPKRRLQARNSGPPPPDIRRHRNETIHAPDTVRGLFNAPRSNPHFNRAT